MKAHKLEIIVLAPNQEDLDIEDVKIELENGIGSDYLIHIIRTETKEVDNWSDNHPMNFSARKANNYFNRK